MAQEVAAQIDTPPLLQAIGITKHFGPLLANDAIDLDLRPGEIHALLGENGAGKSTLVKILFGLLAPDSGTLLWQGSEIMLTEPAQARALGIAMVFQHFSLFENLTVAENVALGLDRAVPLAGLSERIAAVSREYRLALEPGRPVWRLSVGERQRIEIVRALLQDPKLLILDEPTAVLTPQEAEELFRTLRALKEQSRAILYISHKLEEVRALCDRATILRGGRKIATCDPRRETAASLARMMVGSDIADLQSGAPAMRAGARLTVEHLTLTSDDPHAVSLQDVSLSVAGGEVVGIAGVAGNGQDELFAALAGERPVAQASTVRIDGRDAGQLSVAQRRRLGAAFVPEERLGHATAPSFRLSDNVLLTRHHERDLVRHGFLARGAMLAEVDRITAAFDVRKGKRDPQARTLSGGNLQKFAVGREVLREPGVLVVNQPTWGLDAGAAAAIRQTLVDLARRGAAVLVISQDLDELIALADRIAVIYRGRLLPTGRLSPVGRFDREEIGLLMGGASACPGEVEAGSPNKDMRHA